MKIRNGFVSNSSSSSYVIFGWEFENEYVEKLFGVENIYEIYDFEGKHPHDGESYVVTDNMTYIGYKIFHDDLPIGCDIISIDNMTERINKIKEKYNFKDEPKIYTGNYYT